MTSATKSFARRLRQARRSSGMTQHELGARAGISGSQVYRLEAAEREPRLSTLVSLARALGKDPSDMVRGLN
ncbi:MAG TPA: helix-turn-helix transcriptional regulator [Thermoleophilaceae bacterium]|nr:helix-turn-helix transcriptional regulator [Thermoleophilaceae bacterium]